MRNALTIGVNSEGVYLSMFVLFRIAAPPLFIPWADVFAEEEKGLMNMKLAFKFRKAQSVTLRVNSLLGRQLLQYSPNPSQGSVRTRTGIEEQH